MPEQTKIDRLQGPMITRAEGAKIEVIDDENRRVRVSFSSEYPVKRESWFDDPWIEVLGHDESEIDMERFATGGAPLLYGHSSYSHSTHIGVVERAWVENGRGMADVRFSKRAEVDDIYNDVKDRILTGVSVGYKISERSLVELKKDEPSTYRVTRWHPMEISLVPIPADPTVGVGRSETYKVFPVGLTADSTHEGRAMPEVTQVESPVTQQDEVKPVAAESRGVDESAVVRAERQRAADIRTLARKHKVEEAVIDQMIDSGMDMQAARGVILDHLAATQVGLPKPGSFQAGPSGDQRFLDDAAEAIMARAGHGQHRHDNPLRGYTLVELARRCLEMRGVNTGSMDKMHMVGRAFTQSTSDFPVLLENVMHKVLQNAYATQADTWSRFCATGSVSDFRYHNRYRLGSIENIRKVNELGEFENLTIPDGERGRIIAQTKGGIINISRQSIVNDDIGSFLTLAAMLGRSARRTVEMDVYSLLAENAGLGPTMDDGFTLFSAQHSNIATSAALSVEGLDSDRVVMAEQMDVSGNDFLDLRPSVLLLPIGLGGTARIINNAQFDPGINTLQTPNKVQGLFNDIVDTPRISGTRRYLFANPSEAPVIEVAFLDGQQSPFLDNEEGFTVDGVRWKVRMDYGIAAIDYRGAVTNDGIGDSN
jgi:phage head maturation protease